MSNYAAPWTQEEIEILIKNYPTKGGKTRKLLPDRSKTSIEKKAKKLGINYERTEALSKEDKDFIRTWYPIFGGVYCRTLLGKTKSEVQSFASKEGIRVKSIDDIFVTDCIENYFNIWSPQIVYILGYIWADGYLGKRKKGDRTLHSIIMLTIHKDDADVIKKDINSFYRLTWGSRWVKPYTSCYNGKLITANKNGYTTFYLCDKFFGKFLFENDYAVKSGASAEKILSLIPEKLKHYWWRGFFDGDGSFYIADGRPNASISSVRDQDWSFYQELCDLLQINFAVYRDKKTNVSQVRIARKNDVIKFMEYIYQGKEIDGVGLNRKYEKFLSANLEPIVFTSKRKGVWFSKVHKTNPWMVDFKGKYRGCFPTEEKAIERITEIENEELQKNS